MQVKFDLASKVWSEGIRSHMATQAAHAAPKQEEAEMGEKNLDRFDSLFYRYRTLFLLSPFWIVGLVSVLSLAGFWPARELARFMMLTGK